MKPHTSSLERVGVIHRGSHSAFFAIRVVIFFQGRVVDVYFGTCLFNTWYLNIDVPGT